jgi:hypothetical protein
MGKAVRGLWIHAGNVFDLTGKRFQERVLVSREDLKEEPRQS